MTRPSSGCSRSTRSARYTRCSQPWACSAEASASSGPAVLRHGHGRRSRPGGLRRDEGCRRRFDPRRGQGAGRTGSGSTPSRPDSSTRTCWRRSRRRTAGRVAATPLGRLSKPEDVADVIAFLLSDEARFVTGQVIEVDGGLVIDVPIDPAAARLIDAATGAESTGRLSRARSSEPVGRGRPRRGVPAHAHSPVRLDALPRRRSAGRPVALLDPSLSAATFADYR